MLTNCLDMNDGDLVVLDIDAKQIHAQYYVEIWGIVWFNWDFF